MTQKVLSYDLGGTKIAVGVVASDGEILHQKRVAIRVQDGKNAVLNQLTQFGLEILAEFPEISRVGIASAGPLDPKKGLLLDPTNLKSSEGTWGVVPLTDILSTQLQRPVLLENDAAAAALAEMWLGAAQGYQNSMVLTLGTGLGTGIICNGELLRAGRFLHPEAGHLSINAFDTSAPCGCGNIGCAEAYLSARNFALRTEKRSGLFSARGIEPDAKTLKELALQGNEQARVAFAEYAQMLAIAIHSYVRIYSPEIIVFAGSFAEASELFIPQTYTHLEKLLARYRSGVDLMPKLASSTLNNDAGLIGGAYIALH